MESEDVAVGAVGEVALCLKPYNMIYLFIYLFIYLYDLLMILFVCFKRLFVYFKLYVQLLGSIFVSSFWVFVVVDSCIRVFDQLRYATFERVVGILLDHWKVHFL